MGRGASAGTVSQVPFAPQCRNIPCSGVFLLISLCLHRGGKRTLAIRR
jgi:hypothetical protein